MAKRTPGPGYYEAVAKASRALLLDALIANGGNATKTMQELNLPRPSFYRLLRRYGLKRDVGWK